MITIVDSGMNIDCKLIPLSIDKKKIIFFNSKGDFKWIKKEKFVSSHIFAAIIAESTRPT